MKIRPQILAAIVLLAAVFMMAYIGAAQAQVSPSEPVLVRWVDSTTGLEQKVFEPKLGTWLSFSAGGVTVLGWDGETGPERFEFVPQDQAWTVGVPGPQVSGDFNGDGAVNIFDLLSLLRFIVSSP